MLLILFAIGAGVFLLFLGSVNGKNSSNGGSNGSGDDVSGAALSAMEWCRYLEEEAQRLCLSVDGVSNVTVVVTLSESFEQVYAANTESRDGRADSKYITVGSGSSAHLCQTGVTMPRIAGIGIVCRGASSPGVMAELTSLVAAAFGIGTNKIYISGTG